MRRPSTPGHYGLLHRETWNAEFDVFAETHRVIRWGRRGYEFP